MLLCFLPLASGWHASQIHSDEQLLLTEGSGNCIFLFSLPKQTSNCFFIIIHITARSPEGLALHKRPHLPANTDKTEDWNSGEGKAWSSWPRSSQRSMENIFFVVFCRATAINCSMGRNELHTQPTSHLQPQWSEGRIHPRGKETWVHNWRTAMQKERPKPHPCFYTFLLSFCSLFIWGQLVLVQVNLVACPWCSQGS